MLVNCYNNGSVALWDIGENKQIALLPNVHHNYTYKLRLHSPCTLISCGADGFVVRTDLHKMKHLGSFPHPAGVWCAEKVDNNCVVSVGLMKKVFVWDVRCRRIVQQLRL